MSHQVIERDVDAVFVDATKDGKVELKIGKPLTERFGEQFAATAGTMAAATGPGRWVVPSLLARSASLSATLTPAEARTLAHELLAAAERASGDS
jgi:hypothetical protein